jgi:hypothetical protein
VIETRPLFRIALSVPSIIELGPTPQGVRRIAAVAGGSFDGDRLRGTVLASPAGDWILVRPDGTMILDVRLVLKTDDDQLIYMTYRGVRHGPPEIMAKLGRGEPVAPGSYYFKIQPIFETSSERYDWVNRIVAVGNGQRLPEGPVYEVFEVL